MDVNMIHINSSPSYFHSGNVDLQEDAISPSKEDTTQIEEFNTEPSEKVKAKDVKVMMDQKEVQNFLYMMIGFDIKIESTSSAIGDNINTMA